MLYIKNSINLDYLLKSFIKNIVENWKNPFEPPVVLFSDIKVENWFKLAWINNSGKDSILMNLKTARLEGFVFEAVAGGINSDEKIWYERLDKDVLKSGMVQKLISPVEDGKENEQGKKYYETLESSSVKSFIENDDGSINEIRLNNFAGIMTDIFTEYLSTRSRDFDSGIAAKWTSGSASSENKSFFDFTDEESKSIEKWQKKLFKEMLDGKYFTIPSEKKDEDEGEGEGYTLKYVTLSELIRINKESNGGKLCFELPYKKIFLFGFSGIGQEYREIFRQMSENSSDVDLYVYIQAIERDYLKAENVLLKKWNRSGSENLELWKKNEFVSGKPVEDEEKYSGQSLLKKLQNQILNDESDSSVFEENLKDCADGSDSSITVTSAPSKLREIEAVHSSICSILDSKKKKGEPVSYSDFIVLSPNIQDYRVPVMRVFEQNERFKTNGFPYIPYVMSDYTADFSATASAMEIFVSMIQKKALDRTDLFEILRNSVVRSARNYSDEEADGWFSWVSAVNGYRDRKASNKEWEKVCRRLMLSELTENAVKIKSEDKEEVYIPYANIDSENSESLYKFIDAVESLENWISDYKDKKDLELSDLDRISDFIESWLKLPQNCPEELNGEHIVYSKIRNEINNQRLLFRFGNKTINARCFFISLSESAKASRGSSSNLFTGGITFGNFALNRIIPAKYVYLIGFDSKVFPGTDYEQTLDLRSKKPAEKGDGSTVLQNKEAFLCQLMAVQEQLHISYVNKNLKKDEDFFRSSVLEDLFDFIKNPEQKLSDFIEDFEKPVSIDEKRSWNELFTQREFRNKRNFQNITKEEQEAEATEGQGDKSLPERVTISKIKRFLENPFISYADRKFDTSEDDEAEEEKTRFEPVEISHLDRSIIIKDEVYKYFESGLKDKPFVQIDSEIKKMKYKSMIPDGIFGTVTATDIRETTAGLIRYLGYLRRDIKNNFALSYELPDFKFNENKTISINQSADGKDFTWILSGTLSGYLWTQQGNQKILEIAEVVPGKDIRPSKNILNPYLTALMLIYDMEEDVPVLVDIHVLNRKERSKNYIEFIGDSEDSENPILTEKCTAMYKNESKQFTAVTKKAACAILQNIYKEMFENQFRKNIPIYVFMDYRSKSQDSVPYSLGNLIEDINKRGETWSFFTKKALFNPYKDFGFSQDKFGEEFENAKKILANLIRVNY